ncbi:MAG: hypothetical protein ABSH25_18515 [Syntrophorhabdales bacterium]
MDFIEEYKKRLKKAIAAERTNREAAVLSLKMSDGQQWDEGEKQRRTQRGRPVLTGNLLEASIMQAVGDERHNHARVKVRPVSVQGDTKLAEIRAGIIAEAEYVSNAESIYDYAHEMQCRGAYGAWRVLTRYCADNPFNKDRVPYLLDPTIRLAAPGVAAIQCELIENYSEVVYGLATAQLVTPAMRHKYVAAVSMESSEAAKTFVNITFPKEMRRWVKLRMAIRHGSDYYSVPPFDSLGAVIGFGDSIKEAIDLVKERVKQVEALSLNTDLGGLDDLYSDIQTGKAYGINF